MAEQLANAYPKKKFFVDMFTRDISLEDCLLDLIDNSIDGLIRSKQLDTRNIDKYIFTSDSKPTRSNLPLIEVKYSQSSVEIIDNCGGIDLDASSPFLVEIQ